MEGLSALGFIALLAKGLNESTEIITAYPEIEGSDILKFIGWTAGAAAVAFVRSEVAQHYRSPRHVPAKLPLREKPRHELIPVQPPACLLARFLQSPEGFESGTTYVCGAKEVSEADPPAHCEHSGEVEQLFGSSFLNENPASSCSADMGRTVVWPTPPNQPD